jgi:Ca2+-transporting ATPase
LAKIITVICVLVWVMNYNNFFDPIHGSPIKGCIHYFKIAISLAVAAIPEGLPAVITTCLALGTRKMAANNAIVRRLPSVETLGCTTVICSDKTGTLTKNQMCAVRFTYVGSNLADLKSHVVEEKSYSPVANVTGMSAELFSKVDAIKEIASICSLNNNASIVYDKGFQKMGEPTEAAMKVLAEKLGQYDVKLGKTDLTKSPTAYSDYLWKSHKRIATLDFTSERKTMSIVLTGFKGQSGNTLILKGAPERVIEKCTTYKKDDNSVASFSEAEKKKLNEQIQQFASEGLRILAVAAIYDGGKLKDLTEANATEKLSDITKYAELEVGGTFLGVIAIRDPPRDEVADAIQACKTAGIRVIMITGDSKETAVAIAKELRIIDKSTPENSFSGYELIKLTAAQKKKALSGHGGMVFSRVEPSHKRELVKILIDAVSIYPSLTFIG